MGEKIPDRLITLAEAAAYLDIPPKRLRSLHYLMEHFPEPKIPVRKYQKIAAYSLREIEAYRLKYDALKELRAAACEYVKRWNRRRKGLEPLPPREKMQPTESEFLRFFRGDYSRQSQKAKARRLRREARQNQPVTQSVYVAGVFG